MFLPEILHVKFCIKSSFQFYPRLVCQKCTMYGPPKVIKMSTAIMQVKTVTTVREAWKGLGKGFIKKS